MIRAGKGARVPGWGQARCKPPGIDDYFLAVGGGIGCAKNGNRRPSGVDHSQTGPDFPSLPPICSWHQLFPPPPTQHLLSILHISPRLCLQRLQHEECSRASELAKMKLVEIVLPSQNRVTASGACSPSAFLNRRPFTRRNLEACLDLARGVIISAGLTHLLYEL